LRPITENGFSHVYRHHSVLLPDSWWTI